MAKVLLLIVGTGSTHNDPENYLRILRKAIDGTQPKHLVLLPSSSETSQSMATKIQSEYSDKINIENIPFPEKSMEFDADKSFMFFNKLFQDLFSKGFVADDIVIDFTHGTKAMSAALYAVGMRYRISDFHYIMREKDENGNFTDERIKCFDASEARFLALLDQCKILFKTWQFKAVINLLEREKTPKKYIREKEYLKSLAKACLEWDRYNYQGAYDVMPQYKLDFFNDFDTSETIGNWLKELSKNMHEASQNEKKDYKDGISDTLLTSKQFDENKKIAVNLLFDIYASGMRYMKMGRYEDAAGRAYRIAELMGQIELFSLGYDSGNILTNNGIIEKASKDDFIFLGRNDVLTFLKNQKKQDKSAICAFLNNVGKDVETRNKSILFHGYKSKANNETLVHLFERLKEKIKTYFSSSEEEFEAKMKVAMFMNNFAGDSDE